MFSFSEAGFLSNVVHFAGGSSVHHAFKVYMLKTSKIEISKFCVLRP